jgi:hypothetical protein
MEGATLAMNNRVDNYSHVTVPDAKKRWLELLAASVRDGTFVKLTLSLPFCADTSLKNVFIRPVALRAGHRLSFVFRHITRDITKNFTTEEGLARIDALLAAEFRAAHLFTQGQTAQLEMRDGQKPRLVLGQPRHVPALEQNHDRSKRRLIAPKQSPWLHALGVTTAEGKVCAGMEAKYRQINKFVEILQPLLGRANRDGRILPPTPSPPRSGGEDRGEEEHFRTHWQAQINPPSPRATLRGEGADYGGGGKMGPRDCADGITPVGPHFLSLVDMGCGKGYLTFAAYELLCRTGWNGASVRGIEARSDLVDLCNRAARASGFSGLQFDCGTIESTSLDRVDVLIALHACDTATDDAIAKGIQAEARLILVAPCCHKELRRQLRPPPALSETLKHGILREHQAEFVTDALRAALLEWAGYNTQIFEFISTEHTAKNLMIAAVKRERTANRDGAEGRARALAAFYGIQSQRLAGHLGFELDEPGMHADRRR